MSREKAYRKHKMNLIRILKTSPAALGLMQSHAALGLMQSHDRHAEMSFIMRVLNTYDRMADYETEYKFYFTFRTTRGHGLGFPTFIRPITIDTAGDNKEISDNLLGVAHIILFDHIVSCFRGKDPERPYKTNLVGNANAEDLMQLEAAERRTDLAPMIAAVVGKDAAQAIIRYVDCI